MGLYLGPLLQAVRWDQIKGCKPLIEDWLCDMCTVHAVKSNFQMCEATLMGLYVLYQHIKNLSVELVSPKKKNCAKQRSTEQELLLGRWSGRVCGNVERLLVKVDGRKLWELACVVWISYLRSGDEYLRGRGLSVEVAMEVAIGGCDGEWADRLVSKARYLPQWGSWLWGQGEFNPGDQVSN